MGHRRCTAGGKEKYTEETIAAVDTARQTDVAAAIAAALRAEVVMVH